MYATQLRKGMVVWTNGKSRYRLIEPFIDRFILGKHIDPEGRVSEQPDTLRVSDLAQVEVREANGMVRLAPIVQSVDSTVQ